MKSNFVIFCLACTVTKVESATKRLCDVVSNQNRLVYYYSKIFHFRREFYETGKYNGFQLNSNTMLRFGFLESDIG